MKLIIQIPCYNEASNLAQTLAALPKQLPGIDTVEWLIINDGSTDNTVRVAKENGVDHVVSHPQNLGLARAFMTGITTCLDLGADIIVNTDADNQYDASSIPDLIKPILNEEADMVLGYRPIDYIEHFSVVKKLFQKFGSLVVRLASNTQVIDAPSGFRALSRETAMQTNVFSPYTYTLETIIQAGRNKLKIISVPVMVNPELRPSRLIKNIPTYIYHSILTILRVFTVYNPLKVFLAIGLVMFLVGLAFDIRWLILFFSDPNRARVPSLILGLTLIIGSFFTIAIGIIGDLLSVNRRLLEEIRYLLLKNRLK